MRADGDNIYIRLLELSDGEALLDLRRRNADFLRPWEPRHFGTPLTLDDQRLRLEVALEESAADRAYHFGIFTPNDLLVGTITLSNVVRRAWQSATVGYFVDETHNGCGFATDAVQLVTGLAFRVIGLHRLQAGVMPRNRASMRVLEKGGFRREGLSLNYLHINEVWEDHVMFALTVEDLPG